MKNKIHNFDTFVQAEYRVNEGVLSDIMTKIKDWSRRLKEALKQGLMKIIPSGPKKGTPIINYYSPSNGDIVDQIRKTYAGTKFSEMTPFSDSEMRTVNRIEKDMSYGLDESSDVVPLGSPSPQFIRDVKASELIKKIQKLYKTQVLHKDRKKANLPIFVYGAPGIGKTEIVGQAAQDLGVDFITMDLQFFAPEDFIGIPQVVDGRTYGNPPIWLPETNGENGKGGILFFDEMNRANKRVLDSLMNFVQQGRISESPRHYLADKWVIVAAGNRPQEATVTEFDFALADRFDVVNFEPDPEEWAAWAKKKGSMEGSKWPLEIVNFVQKNTQWFHRLSPSEMEQSGGMGGKFPTPRSWTKAMQAIENECILSGVDSWRDLPFEDVMTIIRDTVGLSAASAIKDYLSTLSKFSDKDIRMMYMDPDKAPMIKEKAGLEHILYGLYFIIKKEAELELGSPLKMKTLYNIAKYFDRYQQHEIMTAMYTRMKADFPDLELRRDSNITNILKDPTHPEHDDAKMKYQIAKMLQGQLGVEGIITQKDKDSSQA